MSIVLSVLRTICRVIVILFLFALTVGYLVARYFLRLVSSITKIFAPLSMFIIVFY